jgi:DNA modification methylase
MAKRAKRAKGKDGLRVIYCGDNLDKLRELEAESINLVYIDPPFNSNRNYEVFWGEAKEKRAFEDRHESTRAYIDFMRPRCVELARVLKKTGSFYYHCDWHASHYVKVMLDQVFGENNFQSEIVWKRTPFAGSSKSRAKFWPRVHDVILFYTGGGAHTFNPDFIPYSDEYKKRFKNPDDDSKGPWQSVLLKTYSQETLDRLRSEGALIEGGSQFRYKFYLKDAPGGTPRGDLWADDEVMMINPVSKERLGYPTQKPLSLLLRIVKASSNPGDVVLDAFCGCGTALVAAERLGRRWIGIDVSPTACRVIAKRLRKDCLLHEGEDFIVRDLPRSEDQLRKMPHFEFENWAVIALGGIPNKAKVGDMGIDGRIYPVSAGKAPKKDGGQFDFMNVWYPVQVKQKDRAGRPDIDAFEAVMVREDRQKGFFVSFGFTSDAETEISAFFKRSGKAIIPLTVREILDEEIAMKLA